MSQLEYLNKIIQGDAFLSLTVGAIIFFVKFNFPYEKINDTFQIAKFCSAKALQLLKV